MDMKPAEHVDNNQHSCGLHKLNINIEKGGTNMDETDQEYLDEYLLHYGI
jgi:hypothetical protein